MVLVVISRRCKHERVVYLTDYIERFGDDYPAKRRVACGYRLPSVTRRIKASLRRSG
jgi:hypothetical protein